MPSLKDLLFDFIAKFARFRHSNPKTAFLLVVIFVSWLYQQNKHYLRGKKSLKNKVVLITGGASGIGRATALICVQKGAIVVIWDINDNGLKEMKPNVALTMHCDITSKEKVFDCASQVIEQYGKVDVLINNAGIVIGKSLFDLTEKQIRLCFDVNVISHFWTIQAFLPKMIEQQSGHIVTISSCAGKMGISLLTDYCATKFACRGLTEAVYAELIDFNMHKGIHTTTVMPTFVKTGMFEGAISSKNKLIGALTGNVFLETDYVANEIVTAIQYNTRNLILSKQMGHTMSFEHSYPNELKDYLLAKGPSMHQWTGRK